MPDGMTMEVTGKLGHESEPQVIARAKAQAKMDICYLRKRDTDRVFRWTEILALRDDMIPCSEAMFHKLTAKRAAEVSKRGKDMNRIRASEKAKAEAEARVIEEQERVQRELLQNEEEILAREEAAQKAAEAADEERARQEAEIAKEEEYIKDSESVDPEVLEELNAMAKPELVLKCQELEIPITGNKPELIQRIQEKLAMKE